MYAARDTRLDRTVAIKVLPATLAADPIFRERFEREARSLSALSHPNIYTVHDVGQHAGVHYLVMEHLEGRTLAAILASNAIEHQAFIDAVTDHEVRITQLEKSGGIAHP